MILDNKKPPNISENIKVELYEQCGILKACLLFYLTVSKICENLP